MPLDAILSQILAAIRTFFRYSAWRENRRRPALRLGVRNDPGRPDLPALTVVDNGDRHQIAFGLRLYNEGDREARNWRVWIAGREQETRPYLDHSSDDPRSFRGPHYDASRWVCEVSATLPADIVTRDAPVTLGGRHALNFRGEPGVLHIDYRLDAEGMPTRAGVLRLEIDWTTRTARFVLEQ